MNSRITNIVLPIIAVIIYVVIDLLYVFWIRTRYESIITDILKGEKVQIDIVAAIICYAFLGLGWYFIALTLALSYYDKLRQRPSWTPLATSALSGLVGGVLYGLVVFGIYHLTTRAIFSSRYPISFVLQDMAWGTLFNMVFTGIYMTIWHRLTGRADL